MLFLCDFYVVFKHVFNIEKPRKIAIPDVLLFFFLYFIKKIILYIIENEKKNNKITSNQNEVNKMITFVHKGDFKSTEKFLFKLHSQNFFDKLDYYGKKGVDALASVTPSDTGLTAASWGYVITAKKDSVSIIWTNSNVTENGTPIAILLQYGHGTGTGGYVQGTDYINPAIKPIFDEIEKGVWQEITK